MGQVLFEEGEESCKNQAVGCISQETEVSIFGTYEKVKKKVLSTKLV